MKSFYFLNLGCPKNRADGDLLRGIFRKNGFHEYDTPKDVDFIFVNTCAFIEQARQETKGEIAELLPFKQNGAKLIGLGCYPVLNDMKKEIPEIDAAFAFNQTEKLMRYLTGHTDCADLISKGRRVIDDLPYAFIKTGEGCDNRCSYCTIPAIRGGYASRQPIEIVAEAEQAAKAGVKEIVLVAQDTTGYGRDLAGGVDLACLCRMLSRVEGIDWIRIMYAHPRHLDMDLAERLFAIDKVSPYLDLPIQHISDRILKAMNRHYDSEAVIRLIDQLRAINPDIALRTTLMTGFPGETDDDFGQMLDFVEKYRFDNLGAFAYSPEPTTGAFGLSGRIGPELALQRLEMLYDVAVEISYSRAEEQVGKTEELLVEGVAIDDEDLYEARSYRQAPEIDGFYYLKSDIILNPGDIVLSKIEEVNKASLLHVTR